MENKKPIEAKEITRECLNMALRFLHVSVDPEFEQTICDITNILAVKGDQMDMRDLAEVQSKSTWLHDRYNSFKKPPLSRSYLIYRKK